MDGEARSRASDRGRADDRAHAARRAVREAPRLTRSSSPASERATGAACADNRLITKHRICGSRRGARGVGARRAPRALCRRGVAPLDDPPAARTGFGHPFLCPLCKLHNVQHRLQQFSHAPRPRPGLDRAPALGGPFRGGALWQRLRPLPTPRVSRCRQMNSITGAGEAAEPPRPAGRAQAARAPPWRPSALDAPQARPSTILFVLHCTRSRPSRRKCAPPPRPRTPRPCRPLSARARAPDGRRAWPPLGAPGIRGTRGGRARQPRPGLITTVQGAPISRAPTPAHPVSMPRPTQTRTKTDAQRARAAELAREARARKKREAAAAAAAAAAPVAVVTPCVATTLIPCVSVRAREGGGRDRAADRATPGPRRAADPARSATARPPDGRAGAPCPTTSLNGRRGAKGAAAARGPRRPRWRKGRFGGWLVGSCPDAPDPPPHRPPPPTTSPCMCTVKPLRQTCWTRLSGACWTTRRMPPAATRSSSFLARTKRLRPFGATWRWWSPKNMCEGRGGGVGGGWWARVDGPQKAAAGPPALRRPTLAPLFPFS